MIMIKMIKHSRDRTSSQTYIKHLYYIYQLIFSLYYIIQAAVLAEFF